MNSCITFVLEAFSFIHNMDGQHKGKQPDGELVRELSTGSLNSPRGDKGAHDDLIAEEAVLVPADMSLLPPTAVESHTDRNEHPSSPSLRRSNTLLKSRPMGEGEITVDLEKLAASIPAISVGSSSIRRRHRMVSRVDSHADLMDAVYGLPGSEVTTPMTERCGPYRHTHRQVSSVQLITMPDSTVLGSKSGLDVQHGKAETGHAVGGPGGSSRNQLRTTSASKVNSFWQRRRSTYSEDLGLSQLYPGGPPVPSGGFKVLSNRGHHLRQMHRDVQKAMQGVRILFAARIMLLIICEV
jgi:hypothetical protein